MSWIDRLENTVFTITTGDGKVFTPKWKGGETTKEFNTSVFDFISQPGSLIDRKKVKARKFPLTFWFDGENNIEQSEAFDVSANDSRVWKIKHPFYGSITGQPISISRNDNNYNVTEFSVDFWETITDIFPKTTIAIADSISQKTIKFQTISPLDYAAKVNLKPADVSTIKSNAEKINLAISSALDSLNYSEYQLLKNEMFANIDNLILAPAAAIKSINEVIALPSKFITSVNTRVSLIKSVYNSVKSILVKPTKNNKAYFEANGGASVLSLADALVNPLPADYVTRNDIQLAVDALQEMYADYLVQLDNSYVKITDAANSFSASNATQVQVQQTVIQAIANLTSLAFDAKQERITVLEKDSNLILLTHKYMGLDELDENIERFRTINNIKNKSLFLIKKGKQIKYYV